MSRGHKFEFSPSIPCSLHSTRAKEAPENAPGNVVVSTLWHHTVPFPLSVLWDSTVLLVSSLLGKPTHAPSHSRCWNSLAFLRGCQNAWLKLCNPGKVSLSQWEELMFIQSTNTECLPGPDTAGHRDKENVSFVNIKLQSVRRLVIPRHHWVSDNRHHVSFSAY